MKSPIICLAGSMKQKTMMDKIARHLTWKGCCVLMPVDMKITAKEIKTHKIETIIEFFRALQYQRILLADLVIAIPKKNGGFGTDTKLEVDFANKYGRIVMKITKPEEIDSEEIVLALKKSKKNTIVDLSTILMEALNIMLLLPNISESWKKAIQDIVREVDKDLFPDYNVARDTVTNVLKDSGPFG